MARATTPDDGSSDEQLRAFAEAATHATPDRGTAKVVKAMVGGESVAVEHTGSTGSFGGVIQDLAAEHDLERIGTDDVNGHTVQIFGVGA